MFEMKIKVILLVVISVYAINAVSVLEQKLGSFCF